MRRNHNWSPNSFPLLFIKTLNRSSMKFSHRVFFYHRQDMEKKRNVKHLYISPSPFLGTRNSQPNHSDSILPPLSWHVSLSFSYFASFVLHPLPDLHLWTRSFCNWECFLNYHHRTTLEACLKISWRETKSWMKSEEFPLHDSLPTKSSEIWYNWLRYEQQGGHFHWYELPTTPPLPPNHIIHSKQTNPRYFTHLYHLTLYLYLINLGAFPGKIH